MEDPVWMKHPETKAIGGPVERQALETVWAARGWEETDPPVEEGDELPEGFVEALAPDAPQHADVPVSGDEEASEGDEAHNEALDSDVERADDDSDPDAEPNDEE